MKRKIIIFAMALFYVSVLPAQSVSGKLTVWSFTDEVDNMIKKWFTPSHPDVQIDYTMFQINKDPFNFQNNLDPVFFSGKGAPDVVVLEAAFVRKYVESGLLLDITDIYEANKNKLIDYPVEVATFNGRVYGLSWQVCPGAFFYRRSLAKKYLGTDDPVAVQKYLSNLEQFLNTAKLLKEKSGGKCLIVSGYDDMLDAFYGARSQPWVENGKLVIDPVMEIGMDYIRNLFVNGLTGGATWWSEEWLAGLRGELKDTGKNPLEVFGVFLPSWGLHYVLKTIAPGTSGDWAMVQGPLPYSRGGTWIAATKNTKNPDAAKELIRYLTTDNGFLEAYAKESGDVVSNTEVINKIKNSFKEPFLSGQNHYAAFADMAKNVDGKLIQGTDDLIKEVYVKELWAYVHNEKTKAQALADFKKQAASTLSAATLKKLRLILN